MLRIGSICWCKYEGSGYSDMKYASHRKDCFAISFNFHRFIGKQNDTSILPQAILPIPQEYFICPKAYFISPQAILHTE